MNVCKERLSLMSVLTVITLGVFFLASSAPALAVSSESDTAPAPGSFAKKSPANNAVLDNPDQTLSWEESSGATHYEVCVTLNLDNPCVNTWTPVGLGLHQEIVGLLPNTPYYWQVRANTGPNTPSTYADNGDWYTFHTELPAPFGKTSPPPVKNIGTTSLTLTWNASSNVARYEYCFDATIDATCDTPWTDVGLDLSVPISVPVVAGVKNYYWQVRAINKVGTIESDSGNWWMFVTQPPLSFKKQTPANQKTTFLANPTIIWTASSNATRYEFCIDTSDNNTCDTSWQDRGSHLTAILPTLQIGTPYYWQVRAVNDFGAAQADTTTWWRLTRLFSYTSWLPSIGR